MTVKAGVFIRNRVQTSLFSNVVVGKHVRDS